MTGGAPRILRGGCRGSTVPDRLWSTWRVGPRAAAVGRDGSRDGETRAAVLWTALIVALTALAYANAFGNAFVFDDVPLIRDNLRIRSVRGLVECFRTSYRGTVEDGLYRPLPLLSFGLNYALTPDTAAPAGTTVTAPNGGTGTTNTTTNQGTTQPADQSKTEQPAGETKPGEGDKPAETPPAGTPESKPAEKPADPAPAPAPAPDKP